MARSASGHAVDRGERTGDQHRVITLQSMKEAYRDQRGLPVLDAL